MNKNHRKIYPEKTGIMIWCPNTSSPEERVSLKMWRELKPLMLDRLCLVSFHGVITSRKRRRNMKVLIQLLGFHRLLPFVKQTISGRTRTRHATPLGDGRGVPKNFLDFGRFSKHSKCSKDFGRLSKFSTKCSQPTLLEGFALRSRKSRSVFRSSDPFGKVIVLLVRGPGSSITLVRGDITRMTEQDISSVESLFSLVESMDFDLQMGDFGESLMTEAELVANLPDDFLNPPLLPPPTASPPRAPSPTPLFPVLQLSSTIPTNLIQLRQVGEPGPDGQVVLEVVTDNLQLPLDALPDDLGYSSLPSSSSSVSPSSPTPEVGEVQGESKEERRLRLQAEACRRHRKNKKRKLEEERAELEQLEKRNVELRAKHQAMLEELERWRSMVMVVVAGKKRKRGGEDEEEMVSKIWKT